MPTGKVFQTVITLGTYYLQNENNATIVFEWTGIVEVKTFKYLGVHFSSDLKLDTHITTKK